MAQQAEKQQLEQNNSLGTPNELTAKVANQTAFLIDDYARKRLSDTDHKNVQDVLKFVDTWNDPKEKLEFLVNFAGMIMTESNLRGGSMSLDQLAAFARKGSELKKSGGTWKPDERSNVSYDPGDIKQVLKNYVGGAEQYSPEYRARNNRELAINAASFLVPGALGWVGKAFAGAVSGVLTRAGRLPSAIRRFEKASEVPFTYGQPENPLAAAETDLFGNIVVRNGIQGDELTSILLHEGVHRMFSPKPGSFLAAFRAEQGLTAYNQLHLVRYIEEAWAETAASGSLRTGLAFPFRYPETYKISPLRLAAEGTGYVGFTIGSSYTAYKWASGGGK